MERAASSDHDNTHSRGVSCGIKMSGEYCSHDTGCISREEGRLGRRGTEILSSACEQGGHRTSRAK